jgi:hypothetical protein
MDVGFSGSLAVKNDGAKQLHAYVQAVRKQGGKLLIPTTPRSQRRQTQRAAVKAEPKKNSN